MHFCRRCRTDVEDLCYDCCWFSSLLGALFASWIIISFVRRTLESIQVIKNNFYFLCVKFVFNMKYFNFYWTICLGPLIVRAPEPRLLTAPLFMRTARMVSFCNTHKTLLYAYVGIEFKWFTVFASNAHRYPGTNQREVVGRYDTLPYHSTIIYFQSAITTNFK